MNGLSRACVNLTCGYLTIPDFIAFCAADRDRWRWYSEGRLGPLRIKVMRIVYTPRGAVYPSAARFLLNNVQTCNRLTTAERKPVDLMRTICTTGPLQTVQWIAEAFAVTPRQVRASHNAMLRRACASDQCDIAQWLVSHFALTDDDARDDENSALIDACTRGQLELAEWLVGFGLTADDARSCNNAPLRLACAGGHIEVVQWLVWRFGLTVDDARTHDNSALRGACALDHLELVQWLVWRFGLPLKWYAVLERVYADWFGAPVNVKPGGRVLRWLMATAQGIRPTGELLD